MKRRLTDGESSVDGYAKSAADDFLEILRLLHKVKHFLYERCWKSIIIITLLYTELKTLPLIYIEAMY